MLNLKFKITIAKSEHERNIAYQLRHITYKEAGLINSRAANDYFSDPYDQHATIFLLYLNDHPIGTIRVILANKGPLEIEHATDDIRQMEHYLASCEIGRLCILKKYRSHHYSVMLIAAAVEYAMQQDCLLFYLEAKKQGVSTYYAKLGARLLNGNIVQHPKLNAGAVVLMTYYLGTSYSPRRFLNHLTTLFLTNMVKHHNQLFKRLLRFNLATELNHCYSLLKLCIK